MESFARTASSVAVSLQGPPNTSNQAYEREYELQVYRNAYRIVDSFVNDLSEVIEGLPDDLVRLHVEAERALRRFQIKYPADEEDLQGALAWMFYYGNDEDLQIIRHLQSQAARRFPDVVKYITATMNAIVERSAAMTSVETASNIFYVAIGAVLVVLFGAAIGSHNLFGQYALALAAGLFGGGASAAFLLREGLNESKGTADRICLLAAGFLMLIETVSLLRIGT